MISTYKIDHSKPADGYISLLGGHCEGKEVKSNGTSYYEVPSVIDRGRLAGNQVIHRYIDLRDGTALWLPSHWLNGQMVQVWSDDGVQMLDVSQC